MAKMMRQKGEVAGGSATQMLREDHKKVKELFEQFEQSEDRSEKGRIAEKALVELTIHATLEEELFYPAVREEIEEKELVGEAIEEHHVAKILIGELASLDPSNERFEAKFMVLAESVKHHIEEEEGEMLPKIEQSGFDLESLGEEMAERKSELLEEVTLESIGSMSDKPEGGTGRRRISKGQRANAHWVRRAAARRRQTSVRRGQMARRGQRSKSKGGVKARR
mgnify:CR=1 FL=1